MSKKLVNPSDLHKYLRYDPNTGLLYWRPRAADMFEDGCCSAETRAKRWNARYANREALACRNSFGYKHGSILNVSVDAHRVVWALEFGAWPVGLIDHIDGDPTNNKLDNLRVVTEADNPKNAKTPKHNTSGVLGVYPTRSGKWAAGIRHRKVSHYLGCFETVQEAAAVREKANVLFGFHENHGRIANAE